MATPFPVNLTEDRIPSAPLPAMAPSLQQEGQAVQAELRRERTSIGGTIQAAAQEWATADIARWATTDTYEPEEGFNFTARLHSLDFTLSEDEQEFLTRNKAVSNAQFNDQVTRIKQRRENFQAMGDNPVTGLLASIGDPAWWGLAAASGGLGTLARVGQVARTAGQARAVVGLTEAAGAAGIGAIQREASPTDMVEVATNVVAGAVGAQFMYRGGRYTRDPDWPTQELQNVQANLPPAARQTEAPQWIQKTDADGNPVFAPNGKPVYVKASVPEVVDLTPRRTYEVNRVVDEVADAAPPQTSSQYVTASGRTLDTTEGAAVLARLKSSADSMVAQMARHLEAKAGPLLQSLRVARLSADELAQTGSGRPFYSSRDHRVVIGEATDDATTLHEIAHGVTVAKLNYGAANPATVHGKLVRELEGLRRLAKARADELQKGGWTPSQDEVRQYLSKNVQEFVAGLYTGDTPFLRMLAQMQVPQKRTNVLTELFRGVRRLLGFSVSEESALAQALKITDDLLELPVNQRMLDDAATNRRLGDRALADEFHAPPQVKEYTSKLDEAAKAAGHKLGWNLHKTLGKWNKQVADLFVDDPTNMSGNSIESQRRAIRADLSAYQYRFEEALKEGMAQNGYGTLKRLSPGGMKVQHRLEKEVMVEMLRREQLARQGLPTTPVPNTPAYITKMADALDELAEVSLAEMKRAGVVGADTVDFRQGYIPRRWNPAAIEDAMQRMMDRGMDRTAARATLVNMVAGAARRANGWDQTLSNDVAAALIDRAIRKGNHTDASFRHHAGNEAVAEVRDILTQYGLAPDRLQRALDVITGVTDEAGKMSALKHRIDLDMRTALRMPDGSELKIHDLLDSNITRMIDRYLDGVAAKSAYARKGLFDPSDVAEQRRLLIESIPADNALERADAARLFDDLVNFQNGLPAGEDLPRMMRLMSDVTQMVGLSSSGLWQITEFNTIMQRYGLARTLKYMLAELPVFRQMFDSVRTREGATHLKNVLARQSTQDIRLRPFINRMEDNFDIPMNDVVQAALKNSKQWVPYLNGMKYIHHHQAHVTANLIVDTLGRASSQDPRAMRLLAGYGLEGHIMDDIAREIATKGHDVSRWSDDIWDKARGPLTKMMDDAVLRARIGEVPAFAQFSSLGKFIFTFRSFVLAAHNKLLAGTLGRHGFAGLTLLMLYQWPLAQLAVQADSVIKGKGFVEEDDLPWRTLSQFGSIGLASELVGLMSGQKQQFGAPGFIALDRLWKFGGTTSEAAFGEGSWSDVGKDALNVLPIAPIIPGIQAIRNNL